MITSKPDLMNQVRNKFAHVDTCPEQGPRIFFENAGGALTLKSVVETSTRFAAIPDNQGRENQGSYALGEVINQAKLDAMIFLNASSGQIFVGESGTELLFRMISNAVIETADGGNVVGTTLEHPASRSAAQRWSKIANKEYISVPHNSDTGSVSVEDYAKFVTAETRVATLIHTSPVTGMGVDIQPICELIRKISPRCFIIVDGIQHAAHGGLDIDSYDIDGYAISPYKVFSRHGYGVAWISDRLTELPHDSLIDGPAGNWELGTRDTGSYATFSDVVNYFEWLGGNFCDSDDRRTKIEAAGSVILEHEKMLTNAMLFGVNNLKGLANLDEVTVIGGENNPQREGLVAMNIEGLEAGEIVSALNERSIRVHIRKADHYSGNILNPLGLPSCVRVSMCHYNTIEEVEKFLEAIRDIIARR